MRIIVFITALLMLIGCAQAENEITDDRRIAITVNNPRRVVCLYGSYAEAWQLAGGEVVGVTDDAVSERGLSFAGEVEIIGTTKEPNLELVIALEPDLVILSMDIVQQLSACEVLESAGIACAAFRVDTWRDYVRMMDSFTTLTGRRDLYDSQIPALQADIEAVIAAAARQEAPSILLLRAFSTGVRAKGTDNLAGAMLADLGCTNIAESDDSLLEELSLEAIIEADPDFIFISVMGGDEAAALDVVESTIGANPAWQALTAVQNGRVHVLPRELFHYKPNSRWGESYAYLAELLFSE